MRSKIAEAAVGRGNTYTALSLITMLSGVPVGCRTPKSFDYKKLYEGPFELARAEREVKW